MYRKADWPNVIRDGGKTIPYQMRLFDIKSGPTSAGRSSDTTIYQRLKSIGFGLRPTVNNLPSLSAAPSLLIYRIAQYFFLGGGNCFCHVPNMI